MRRARCLHARAPCERRSPKDKVEPLPPMSGEPLPTILGRHLRRLRNERGLSRELVATRLRVSAAVVAAHERGARRFTAEDLVAYIRLFGIRTSDLFR
jgi:DNA-binding XRE family transcriptional regulator